MSALGCSPAESRYSRSTWSGLTPNKTASWLFGRRGELSGVDHILADVAPVTCQNCGSNYPETMKTECLLRQNKYHTTAWVEAEATKLGLRVEIAESGGLWEIVEIYPYRLTDEQLKTHKTLIAHKRKSRQATSRCSPRSAAPYVR